MYLITSNILTFFVQICLSCDPTSVQMFLLVETCCFLSESDIVLKQMLFWRKKNIIFILNLARIKYIYFLIEFKI